MKLNDNGLKRLYKIKVVATTFYILAIVLSIFIVVILARTVNPDDVLYNKFSSNFSLFMLCVQIIMFLSVDIREWVKRSEIYFEIVEHNEVINLDNVKDKIPKRLLSLRKDEAIIKRVNKDINKLVKYGIIEKLDREVIKLN